MFMRGSSNTSSMRAHAGTAVNVLWGGGGPVSRRGVTEASSVRPSCPRVGGQRRRTVEFQSSEMEVAKLKVVELRKRLQDMGLDTTGLKAVLVQRLESAMQADKAPPAEAKQEDDEAATEAVKVATYEDVARNTAAKAVADNEAAVPVDT